MSRVFLKKNFSLRSLKMNVDVHMWMAGLHDHFELNEFFFSILFYSLIASLTSILFPFDAS